MLVGSCNARFWGLDRDSGDMAWFYDISEDGDQMSFHGETLIDRVGAVIGTDITEGHVYAFDPESGEVSWKFPVDSGVGTDIVGSANTVFALSHAHELLALDRTTGELRWSFDATGPVRGGGTDDPSPAVAGALVFVPGSDRKVHALDAATGQLRWSTKLDGRPSTSILVSHGAVFVGAASRTLYRLDPESGAVLRTLELEFAPHHDIAATETALLILTRGPSGKTALVGVRPDLSARLWSREPPDRSGWSSSRPYVRDQVVVAGTMDGQVAGLRLGDGAIVWTLDVGGVVKVVGGSGPLLLVGTQGGTLHGLHWP